MADDEEAPGEGKMIIIKIIKSDIIILHVLMDSGKSGSNYF